MPIILGDPGADKVGEEKKGYGARALHSFSLAFFFFRHPNPLPPSLYLPLGLRGWMLIVEMMDSPDTDKCNTSVSADHAARGSFYRCFWQ